MEERGGTTTDVGGKSLESFRTVLPSGENASGGGVAVVTPPADLLFTEGKKKRGRPRKYVPVPDGNITLTLSAMPISSQAPAAAQVTTPGGAASGELSVVKRSRGRPLGSLNKPKLHLDLDSVFWFHQACSTCLDEELGRGSGVGEWVAWGGANFTPHVITVAAGEDVTMKIISFSQQGPGAICILCANGAISNVTLRQPDSSGGTLTYEGRFEILSLSGSFMPTESGGTRSRTGGMSVCLASPDGRVVGGGVAGLLVAASPVQVVIGSFMRSNPQEQKIRKPKTEPTTTATPATAIPISNADVGEAYSGQGQRSTTPKPNFTASPSFQGENWASLHSVSDSRDTKTDINISLAGG